MPATPLIQTPHLAESRQVVCVFTAADLLGTSTDEIRGLVSAGRLRAWNIAVETFTAAELRIFAADIGALQRGIASAREDVGMMCDVILGQQSTRPGIVATMRANFLAHRLAAGPDHIYGLIAAGWLRVVRSARRGPGGSAQIERASVETFLRKRREF